MNPHRSLSGADASLGHTLLLCGVTAAAATVLPLQYHLLSLETTLKRKARPTSRAARYGWLCRTVVTGS